MDNTKYRSVLDENDHKKFSNDTNGGSYIVIPIKVGPML